MPAEDSFSDMISLILFSNRISRILDCCVLFERRHPIGLSPTLDGSGRLLRNGVSEKVR